MKIDPTELMKMKAHITAMDREFDDWKSHYEEIAKFFLPRRFDFDGSANFGEGLAGTTSQKRKRASRNTSIIDPYGTTALRSLAAGMLNGITSPARPWFNIDAAGFRSEQGIESVAVARWRQEVLRVLFAILAGSNFYNAMAVQFLDLCCFGTSVFLIYEDFDSVIRCYNIPMGQYRITQDHRRIINRLKRSFLRSSEQMAEQFGVENCSAFVRADIKAGGARLQNKSLVTQIIESNADDKYKIGTEFSFREIVFENRTTDGTVLRVRGFNEKPFIVGRWEVTGNDLYGSSPCMDALPQVIELQQVLLEKGKGLAYMNQPPVVMDNIFASKPDALLPGGKTFATNASSFGAKPVYTVQPPINELRQDINEIHRAIDATLYNDLFRMISNLDTVRSATEIDARREERLVLMAAVLERFESDVLDPAIKRTYNIAKRNGLLPEPPAELAEDDINIEYVSILTDAQRSIGTASIERFMSFIAETGTVWPEVLDVPDPAELVRDYGDRLNVPAAGLRSREQVQEKQAQDQELQQSREAALVGSELTNAAQNLSDTDVGGGQNALESLLGG